MSDDAVRTRTTDLLINAGDGVRSEAIFAILYDELRRIASRQLAGEQAGHTLHTTALVHEAYLRLVDDSRVTRKGRAYFFGAAARAMRHVLIDHARRRRALKRGGGRAPITIEDTNIAVDRFAYELIDLDRALEELGRLNPRHARVVECRFFAGLDVAETAAALDVSERTIKSDWAFARAWLHRALRDDESAADDSPTSPAPPRA